MKEEIIGRLELVKEILETSDINTSDKARIKRLVNEVEEDVDNLRLCQCGPMGGCSH